MGRTFNCGADGATGRCPALPQEDSAAPTYSSLGTTRSGGSFRFPGRLAPRPRGSQLLAALEVHRDVTPCPCGRPVPAQPVDASLVEAVADGHDPQITAELRPYVDRVDAEALPSGRGQL